MKKGIFSIAMVGMVLVFASSVIVAGERVVVLNQTGDSIAVSCGHGSGSQVMPGLGNGLSVLFLRPCSVAKVWGSGSGIGNNENTLVKLEVVSRQSESVRVSVSENVKRQCDEGQKCTFLKAVR